MKKQARSRLVPARKIAEKYEVTIEQVLSATKRGQLRAAEYVMGRPRFDPKELPDAFPNTPRTAPNDRDLKTQEIEDAAQPRENSDQEPSSTEAPERSDNSSTWFAKSASKSREANTFDPASSVDLENLCIEVIEGHVGRIVFNRLSELPAITPILEAACRREQVEIIVTNRLDA